MNVGATEELIVKRINEVTDDVFKKFHRTLGFKEFESLLKQSYQFYNKILTLSSINISAVSKGRFPNLICDMKKEEDLIDFLLFTNTELQKKEINDNHK